MKAMFIVAAKEFQDGLRNRWVLAITVILAVLAMGIAYFGAAASGGLGFTSLATTLVSLSTLAVFLIPLIALMLAYDAVVGEQEAGTLLLLLTYPISRSALLFGKFFGHGMILAVATLLGFGIAGMVIALGAESVPLSELSLGLARLIVSSVLLGWVFLAFAYLISVTVSEKARAAGLALGVWFLFVLVFDLVLLALLVGVKQGGDWLLPDAVQSHRQFSLDQPVGVRQHTARKRYRGYRAARRVPFCLAALGNAGLDRGAPASRRSSLPPPYRLTSIIED
ncbi:hypothetical protein HAALTHF_03020n [Vreelandella aquamarina]|nr:hypothetical protein HAALTHF_03020n [Halomonas axialensis]